jgi:hypothetical protein
VFGAPERLTAFDAHTFLVISHQISRKVFFVIKENITHFPAATDSMGGVSHTVQNR